MRVPRKPRLVDYPDGPAFVAALRRYHYLGFIESIREACRTAHAPARWERVLNTRAAEAEERIPFVTVVLCACRRNVPYSGPPGRQWTPGEEPDPQVWSRLVNGPKALREALQRAPRGSRVRAEALAAWTRWVDAEARRQIEAEDARGG